MEVDEKKSQIYILHSACLQASVHEQDSLIRVNVYANSDHHHRRGPKLRKIVLVRFMFGPC